jgi:hypothetical protein
MGGSTVLSAANIQVIARARAFASSGSKPVMLADMEHDGPGLEKDELAFFVRRELPEWMPRPMCPLFRCRERDRANIVVLADFFEGPAHAYVARKPFAAIGGTFEGGDGGGHGRSLLWRSLSD